MTARSLALVALALPPACAPVDPLDGVDVPLLADVSGEADAAVDLVSREDALAGALDWDLADPGDALDMAGAPAGFFLDFDGQAITDAAEDAGVPPPAAAAPTHEHILAAWAAVVWADLITLSVVGPPAYAIAVAADGTITELDTNVWYAENTVDIADVAYTTHLTVAWVGVGWLAEMRLSSDDGALDHDLWFAGFLAYGGGLGWWDVYQDGALLGVVEWIADGAGDAEFGMAAVSGPEAGSALAYVFLDDSALVSAHSGPTGEDAWVYMAADRSGEVRIPDWNGGEPGCWDVRLADAACE